MYIGNIDDKKIKQTIGKHYDLEVIINNSYLETAKNCLYSMPVKRYSNVELVNMNKHMHFLTEDGEYLMLPWQYIISMVPSLINKS